MRKNISVSSGNSVASKLAAVKLWAATAACLVLSAALIPVAGNGNMISGSAMEDATQYSCSAGCYDKYYTCIYAGKGSTYCQSQLSWCLANCGTTARVAQ